jgi:hypothetical protein
MTTERPALTPFILLGTLLLRFQDPLIPFLLWGRFIG